MATLSYATPSSGVDAGGIGWINYGALSLPPGTTLTNQTATLKDGSILRYTLSNTAISGGGGTLNAVHEPIYALQSFAVVGYTGLAGNTALYAGLNGSTEVTLSNISVVDPAGNPIPYNIYSADGEATGFGSKESIVFNTNGTPWTQLTLLGPGTNPTISGMGTSTVTLTGVNDTSYSTPVIYSQNPTVVSGILKSTGGNQGIVFGVSINKISLNKVITGRFDPTDQFTLDISGAGTATTTTFGSTYGAQAVSAYIYTATTPSTFNLNEIMASGSGSSLSQYKTTIAYTNLTSGTTVPTSTTIPGTVTINNADIVVATITNSPIAPTLTLNKQTINFQQLNSIVPYTLTLTNNGLVSITNVILKDTIPTGTTFIASSLSVNGVPISGNPSPPTGINLGTIPAGETFTVTFNVEVGATAPNPNPIKNNATATFGYDLYPTTGTGSSNSPTVSTLISDAIVTSTKQVNKTLATIGDVITYTLTFKNTGNTVANNLVFVDTIPNGETLVANSVTVNGNTRTGVSPNPPGFTITVPVTTLAVGSVITVAFKTTINTTPNPNPILNTGALSYTFTLDPSVPNGNSGTVTSNSVSTLVAIPPTAPLVKSVDLANANIGDTLTYTIAMPNNGSVTAFNVILKDTIPAGTTFVSNSLTLNGVTQSGATIAPPTGFTVGTISANTTSTVTFSVTVVSIPTTNPTPNSATTTFNAFTTTTIASSANSNIVATTIVNATLSTTKTVSETSGYVGDILTYTIVLNNTGNITANNILFVDTIPTGTTFVPNSFTLNGVVQSGISPAPPGTAIPDIGANGVTTVTFNVTIDTIPTPNPTTNTSTTGYNFILPPSTVINSTTNSNTVATFVNPDSNPLKIVSENYGSIGDILTYTIRYQNNSTLTATSVTFFDTIPSGTTFIANSVTVNGVATPGTIAPPTGITVPDIAPNAITTVIFKVTVDTLPTPNPIPNEGFLKYTDFGTTIVRSAYSNTVTTEINQAIISPVSKTVDQVFAGLGDVLTYTINLYNSGNVTALNVVVSDTIPNGTTFVTDSITLNGVTQTGTTIAPPTGFTVGTIPVGQTATVAFQVTVVSIPTPNPTPNTATTTYDYVLYSATGTLGSGSNNTNTVNTMIYIADVTSPVKSVDKAYTAIPATLTYTITMVNTGNATALNLMFSDTIPSGTTFIPNSVTLNGATQSGAVVSPPGFMVGTLAAGATATVTFQVTVTTIPTSNPILNSGVTNYSYVINPITSSTGTGSGNTNTATTSVNYADLSGTTKSVSSPYGTCGDILTYTITIPNNGNVSAFNVFIQDTIPSGTVLVPNSLLVNGITQVGGNPSIGVTIPSIAAGGTATLSFMVQVQC